ALSRQRYERNLSQLNHFGTRVIESLAAFSTADLLNGNLRGVTSRQSSSWSFQCGLDASPDSPSVMPCRVASQSVGLAMKRIETLLPTFTVGPSEPTPFCGIGGIVNCSPISGAAANG